MDIHIDPRSLRQRLDAVPLAIRTKMGLETTTDRIIAIKGKYRVDPKNGILAQLILRMMIEDLAPQYFAWGVKEALGVDPDVAKKISEEVRDKVLNIAKDDFKKIAIDISLVGVMEEPPKQTEGAPIKQAPAPVNVGTMPPAPKAPVPVPQAKPVAPAPAPATPAPFMMHQEAAPTPLATSSDFKLNIPKDVFKPAPSKQVEVPRPPKPAELEIGKAPMAPKAPAGSVSFRATPPGPSRVVHYTDLRTIANPTFGSVPAPAPKMPASTPINVGAMPPAPKAPVPVPQAKPVAPQPAPAPATPTQPKPPKVVNFGPEEVK